MLKKLSVIAAPPPEVKPRPAAGRGLLVRRHVSPADSGLFALDEARFRALGFDEGGVENCLFLDTETTGLSRGAGTVAFLVGLGYLDNSEFVVEQYLMRDYPDEVDLLRAVCDTAQRFRSVVTFNGACFDLPLLESRLTMNRMRADLPELVGIDLLTPSRRLWRLRLGSCRLANLEERVLGIPRENDLPGSEVPERFFTYLKSGDESLLTDVLDHNRQDVITLSNLLVVLAESFYKPEALPEQIDLYSAGRAFENRGERETARRLYTLASAPRPVTSLSALLAQRYAGEANARLYQMHRREGDWDKAVSVLETMVTLKHMGAYPHVELAKYKEHRQRDWPAALRHVDAALEIAGKDDKEALIRRRDRIIRKMG